MDTDAEPIATDTELIRLAVDAMGTQAKLGRVFGISQGAVGMWLKRNRIPAEHRVTVAMLAKAGARPAPTT